MEPAYEALAASMKGSHIRVAKYQADIDREFCNEKLQLKTFPTIVFLPKGSTQVRQRHGWWPRALCVCSSVCVRLGSGCDARGGAVGGRRERPMRLCGQWHGLAWRAGPVGVGSV